MHQTQLIYYIYLDWQHVSTLQGHHQAFIRTNQCLESYVHSWDPKQCLQLANVKGSRPTTIYE